MIAEPASKWLIFALMMSPSRSAYSANTCSRSASRSDCWMTCFAVCAPIRPRADADSSSGIVSPSATSGFIRRTASIWIWSFRSSTLSTTVFRRKTLNAPVWTSTFTSMFSSAPYARLMARAMMSLTTSFGRPFSAESCARPVTSSRFTTPSPIFARPFPGDKKGGSPHLHGSSGKQERPARQGEVYQIVTRGRKGAAGRVLREVVADVRELVHELAAQEDHRHDDRDRDDRNDECIFDEALSFIVSPERHGTLLPASGLGWSAPFLRP